MGRPKATLELEGRSFLRRVIEALQGGGCDPVLAVVAASETRVREEAERIGVRTLVNPDPGEGPITSLRIALNALGPHVDGLVWLPLDHPLVTAGTVATLIAEATRSNAPLTLPVHDSKRGHPALFRRALFPELLDPRLEGGARVVVHRHLEEARLVQIAERGVIEDVDTPEAYARIRATVERSA
jgi:molybdenum cofactor cytidylyltransferase